MLSPLCASGPVRYSRQSPAAVRSAERKQQVVGGVAERPRLSAADDNVKLEQPPRALTHPGGNVATVAFLEQNECRHSLTHRQVVSEGMLELATITERLAIQL